MNRITVVIEQGSENLDTAIRDEFMSERPTLDDAWNTVMVRAHDAIGNAMGVAEPNDPRKDLRDALIGLRDALADRIKAASVPVPCVVWGAEHIGGLDADEYDITLHAIETHDARSDILEIVALAGRDESGQPLAACLTEVLRRYDSGERAKDNTCRDDDGNEVVSAEERTLNEFTSATNFEGPSVRLEGATYLDTAGEEPDSTHVRSIY